MDLTNDSTEDLPYCGYLDPVQIHPDGYECSDRIILANGGLWCITYDCVDEDDIFGETDVVGLSA